MEWEELLKIDFGVPLSEIGITTPPVYSDHSYKIKDNQYILAYTDMDSGENIFFGFVWTASENVAVKLFTGNSAPSDFVDLPPPVILLPEQSVNTYQGVVRYGKEIDPEYFFESASRLCSVHFGDFIYYFRKAFPDDEDQPVAIEVDLRPWKRLKG